MPLEKSRSALQIQVAGSDSEKIVSHEFFIPEEEHFLKGVISA